MRTLSQLERQKGMGERKMQTYRCYRRIGSTCRSEQRTTGRTRPCRTQSMRRRRTTPTTDCQPPGILAEMGTYDDDSDKSLFLFCPGCPVPYLRKKNAKHHQVDYVSCYQPNRTVTRKNTHPMTYGPRPPLISAVKIFLIPASLNIAICSGLGFIPEPAPGGGPLIVSSKVCE
jgi:hypothetical protein